MRKPYLLFDAGGTLIYPDPDVITRVCREYGYEISPHSYLESLFDTLYRLDSALRGDQLLDWAEDFLVESVKKAGVNHAVAKNIVEQSKQRKTPPGLWAYTTARVRTALERLRASGFSMAVVSNSDGTVAQQLSNVGLDVYFEKIFDSAIVGVEKPDPQIFAVALDELNLTPDDCLYVGDIFMFDVLGANRAGIRAVHVDNLGVYSNWPGMHFSHIEEMAQILVTEQLSWDDPRLLVCAAS